VALAILQARMSSSRLPGKVLAPISGRPLILRALERIARSARLTGVVLATSVDASDDPLVEAVEAAGYQVRRGSLQDVLGRFLAVADEFEPDVIVRLTGDNALVDPAVIDAVVAAHDESGADYTSNTLVRTFPRGLDVEAVRPAAIREVERLGADALEREHVTIGVYRRPDAFRLHSVTQVPDRSAMRWTVDYREDLEFARTVYARLEPANPHFGQQDVVEFLEQHPEYMRLESAVSGA